MIKVAPSILSADFANLAADIRSVESADYLHVDIMDGLFVPNISIGIPVVASVRRATDMVLDVHLMIDRPVRYVQEFAKAGADIITIHLEADTEEENARAIDIIHSCGKKAGVTIKPGTPVEEIIPWLSKVELALVMTVEPGFGGQSFMYDMMPKVEAIRKYIEENKLECELEVDGGINAETAKIASEAGANVLVAGSYVFGAQDRAARINSLR